MKNSAISFFAFTLVIIFNVEASSSGVILSCSHHELCQMAHEIVHENKIESKLSFQNLVNISGDPHEYEPTTAEIKNLINAPFLLTGPEELNPWAKKINFQRSSKLALKTISLLFNGNDLGLYPDVSSEILSHFWLYPKLFCEMKKRLTVELQKEIKSPLTSKCDPSIIEKKLTETLATLKLPVILTHDALQPLFTQLARNKNLIIAIKGSGHHEEANPESIKKMYQALKSPKAIWILETGINVPDNILNKMRKNDIVIKIDTADSKSTYDFSILNDLANKLKEANGK